MLCKRPRKPHLEQIKAGLIFEWSKYRDFIDRRGNRVGLLIQLWIFIHGRLFEWLVEGCLYLPGSSVCDNPGKYNTSYYRMCYKQINVYFIFISIKKFHKD